jgi:hypothetical protein
LRLGIVLVLLQPPPPDPLAALKRSISRKKRNSLVIAKISTFRSQDNDLRASEPRIIPWGTFPKKPGKLPITRARPRESTGRSGPAVTACQHYFKNCSFSRDVMS